jgi:hypothetical protein
MTPDDVKARAVEALANHTLWRHSAGEFTARVRCYGTGCGAISFDDWESGARHQVNVLADAGLLADPDAIGRAKAWDEGFDTGWCASGEGWNSEYPPDAEPTKRNPYRADRIDLEEEQ